LRTSLDVWTGLHSTRAPRLPRPRLGRKSSGLNLGIQKVRASGNGSIRRARGGPERSVCLGFFHLPSFVLMTGTTSGAGSRPISDQNTAGAAPGPRKSVARSDHRSSFPRDPTSSVTRAEASGARREAILCADRSASVRCLLVLRHFPYTSRHVPSEHVLWGQLLTNVEQLWTLVQACLLNTCSTSMPRHVSDNCWTRVN
jgi:hypothetical protein